MNASMLDPAAFQDAFGRALATHTGQVGTALSRALTIHRNTSLRAAQTALADNFPVTRLMVGDDAFAALAHAFTEASPPTDPRLVFYGADFPAFVDDYPPFAEHRYLTDVARIERLVVEALFAADAEPRDPASFAMLELDAPLALHPAVRFVACATPAASLWLAHQNDAADDALESVVWQPEGVLVTRPRNRIFVSVETPAAITFIEGCADGLQLAEAAGAAGDELPGVFARTISAGCFA